MVLLVRETYFVRQYLKLYLDGNAWSDTHQVQDNKNIIIVCKH